MLTEFITIEFKINNKMKRLACTEEEFCEIYCDINSWKWNKLLGETPKNFEVMNQDEKSKIITPIIEKIKQTIGEYKILKYFNVKRRTSGKMTEAEFQEWILELIYNSLNSF